MGLRGTSLVLALVAISGFVALNATAAEIQGEYLETRTCDVYTGPCFANAESTLAGSEALLAWHIEQGGFDDVDLAGLKVVVTTKASGTLGFGGGLEFAPDPIRSVVLVDERATQEQREALVAFVRERGGPAVGSIQDVVAVPIDMQLDHVDMVGQLRAGQSVELLTRKLGDADCVCTNEVVFYPPLAAVENASPAYTVEGRYAGRGLGVNWENPGTRSSFLATFSY